jgi:hypothetical protein
LFVARSTRRWFCTPRSFGLGTFVRQRMSVQTPDRHPCHKALCAALHPCNAPHMTRSSVPSRSQGQNRWTPPIAQEWLFLAGIRTNRPPTAQRASRQSHANVGPTAFLESDEAGSRWFNQPRAQKKYPAVAAQAFDAEPRRRCNSHLATPVCYRPPKSFA